MELFRGEAMNGWNTVQYIHAGLSISIGNYLIWEPYSHFMAKKSHPTAEPLLGGAVAEILGETPENESLGPGR